MLSVRMEERKQRTEALKKLYHARSFVGGGGGGVMGPPSLGDLVCSGCTEDIEASHTRSRSTCWELLPNMFSVAKSWDGV